MMMMPPEEIQKYITIDENGTWIYDKSMPSELIPKFKEFVKQINDAEKYTMEDFMK